MKKSSTVLNNSVAYGFSKNSYKPIIVKALEENGYKCSDNASAAKNSFAPITIKVKGKGLNKELSVICYLDTDTIGVSMYNMLGSKDLVFVSENKLYVVAMKDLQANWSNALSKISIYRDGRGTSSEMSYMDPSYVKSLAYLSLDLSKHLVDMLNNSLECLENDLKKSNK